MNIITKKSTKSGAASLYVVIFATVLFSVILISFVRLTLSEISDTSDDELSQSAYDAAQAGVEDAKIELTKCLSEYNGDGSQCSHLYGNDCNSFKGAANQEVPIQTTTRGTNTENQAYTCVLISNQIDSYQGEITSDHPTNLIKITDASTNRVVVNWSNNASTSAKFSDFPTFPNADNAPNPEVLALTIVKADSRSTLVLYPSENNGTNNISADTINNAANTNNTQSPIQTKCNYNDNSSYKCSVSLDDSTIQYLLVSLPYSNQNTAYEIIQKNNDATLPFTNIQYSIDSTGRANDLYRRIETRVEYKNNFPAPEYAINLVRDSNNSNDSNLNKSFYVTTNCFKSDNGQQSNCSNYGNL